MTDEQESASNSGLLRESSKKLLGIALPAILVEQFNWLVVTETAAVIGKQLGSTELASFSLSCLAGNISFLSIIVALMSACDTLAPRAFGSGNFQEVSRLSMRGFLLCIVVLAPLVTMLCTYFKPLFLALGQDETVVDLAAQWLWYYVLSLPAVLLYRVIQHFLGSQGIVMPLVRVNLLACFLIHPLGLYFLVPAYGFVGSAMAWVVTRTMQSVLLILLLHLERPYHPETWTGTAMLCDSNFWKDVMGGKAMLEYARLSIGGLMILSEWWFWEAVCFIIGTIGVIPLSVHSIVYQLIMVLYTITNGISFALTICLGHLLSQEQIRSAKQLAVGCFIFTSTLAVLISTFMYNRRQQIIELFTSDEDVIEGCQTIWTNFCFFIITDHMFASNMGILTSLGMQARAGFTVIIVLWFGNFPFIYRSITRHDYEADGVDGISGLKMVWHSMNIAYVVLNIVLVVQSLLADWRIKLRKKRSFYEEIEDASTALT